MLTTEKTFATYEIKAAAVGTLDAVTFSPAAGTYASTQSVTLASTQPGVTIYYTTDGSTPTTNSAVYASPISVASTSTITAYAAKSGFTDSAAASAAYVINGAVQTPVATPTISVASGTYNNNQSVTLATATAGASIYYTTDGSTPDNTKTLYSGAITISATSTLKAIGIKSNFSNSAVASESYTMVVLDPSADIAAGTYNNDQSVTLTSATTTASIRYTTNGSTPACPSTGSLYSAPVSITATSTLKYIACQTGYTSSAVQSNAYTLAVTTPAPSIATGIYYGTQSVTITSTTTGTTIYYTIDGSTPTTSSTLYSGAITISTKTTLKALAIKSGYTDSGIASASYTIFQKLANPNPGIGNGYGNTYSDLGAVVELANGNIVISAINDETHEHSNGAVFLFNGTTGALISTLHGSTNSDSVGSVDGSAAKGIFALSNGNFVVISSQWQDTLNNQVGAATWCSGTTGCNGAVSASNSLVGSNN
jgi:hypothetical protein